MSSLPAPTSEALAHSQRLREHIAAEIKQHGSISFARYMELALYAPGLGYYSAGAQKFGASGDFVTAPEISTLFGRTLARQVAQAIALSERNILEVGAGSGKLAVDLLVELERIGSLPNNYYILELSADLQLRQQNRVREHIPHLWPRCRWLDALPSNYDGVIIGNEVLDAMPVHMVKWRHDEIKERNVCCDADMHFHWQDVTLPPGILLNEAIRLMPDESYVSEINLAAPAFIAGLAAAMTRGIILLFDYGFAEHEYYHAQRNNGTLMCHYRHHAHDDPFYLPGLQDITAHVDFSAIMRSGMANNLQLLGYCNQAQFLINCGITDVMSQTPADDVIAYLPLAAEAQKLLSPAEMGELFKVIALGKNCDAELLGFSDGNKIHSQ